MSSTGANSKKRRALPVDANDKVPDLNELRGKMTRFPNAPVPLRQNQHPKHPDPHQSRVEYLRLCSELSTLERIERQGEWHMHSVDGKVVTEENYFSIYMEISAQLQNINSVLQSLETLLKEGSRGPFPKEEAVFLVEKSKSGHSRTR